MDQLEQMEANQAEMSEQLSEMRDLMRQMIQRNAPPQPNDVAEEEISLRGDSDDEMSWKRTNDADTQNEEMGENPYPPWKWTTQNEMLKETAKNIYKTVKDFKLHKEFAPLKMPQGKKYIEAHKEFKCLEQIHAGLIDCLKLLIFKGDYSTAEPVLILKLL